MAGAVFAFGGRSKFRHVLGENVAGRNAFYEQGADVANHGRDPIALLESGTSADRNSFLTQAGIETADDFVLAEEADHALFELAIELHEIIQVEVLFAFQRLAHSSFAVSACSASCH